MKIRRSRFVGAASQTNECGSFSLTEVRCSKPGCEGAGSIVLENEQEVMLYEGERGLPGLY